MKNFVFIGDSLIRCQNLQINDRWHVIIKNIVLAKKSDYSFFNLSLNGATTFDLLEKIKVLKKINNINFLILSIGTNDSVYWNSMNGKPRVSVDRFRANLAVFSNFLKNNKIQNVYFVIPHLFLKSKIEINNKTHNQNIVPYKKILANTSKKFKFKIINFHIGLKKYNRSSYCEACPDGIHLNKNGSLFYYEKIYSKINKLL